MVEVPLAWILLVTADDNGTSEAISIAYGFVNEQIALEFVVGEQWGITGPIDCEPTLGAGSILGLLGALNCWKWFLAAATGATEAHMQVHGVKDAKCSER